MERLTSAAQYVFTKCKKKKKSVCVSALIGSSKPFSQNLSGTIWINPALVIGPYSKPV